MPKRLTVVIGPKTYDLTPGKVKVLPRRDDALDKAKRDINHLKNEISRLESKIRRMKEDLEYEIAGWKDALEAGKRQESIEAIRRRISRLTGACDFQGTIDYDSIDREL
jgi:predicted  nucleic acid-binding Zn-ribbon protein